MVTVSAASEYYYTAKANNGIVTVVCFAKLSKLDANYSSSATTAYPFNRQIIQSEFSPT